jgi:hypothetical protein
MLAGLGPHGYTGSMAKKARKDDINALAKSIVDQATGQVQPEQSTKNPAAVALGRLGGLRGGKVRAAKLSKTERVAIAKTAAAARWKKKP